MCNNNHSQTMSCTRFTSGAILLLFLLVSNMAVLTTSFNCYGCNCEVSSSAGGRLLTVNCNHMGLTSIPKFIRLTNYSTYPQLHLNFDYNNISSINSDDFKGLKNLTNLKLRHNGLSYIDDYAFSHQPYFYDLDLSHNELTSESFAPNSFKTTSTTIASLDLSNNLMSRPPKELTQHAFISALLLDYNPMGPILRANSFKDYPKGISSLSLSGCQLKSIEPNTFHHEIFSHMGSLNLDNNNFNVIDSDFLKGARISSKLTLRNSGIREIKNRTFSRLSGLITLLLSHNNLSNQISRNSFSSMDLRQLELNNCSLRRIRRGFLRLKVINLDLSDNDIAILRNDSFRGLSNTKKLKLNHNKISRVLGKPFTDLDKLKELYLQNNQIDDANLEFLGSSESIERLDISYNHLVKFPDISNLTNLFNLFAIHNNFTDIQDGAFANNKHLQTLHLSWNWYLRHFKRQALRGNKNLKVIDVSHTNLQNLPDFDQLASLTELRLDHSDFHVLPEDLCQICPKLQYLYASHNRLVNISNLINCTSLVHLELEDNRIEHISEKAFKGLSRLRSLSLHTNNIETIHREAFHGLKNLRKLDISHNRLRGLHSGLFDNLTYLAILELQNNRLTSLPENIFRDLIHLEELYLRNNTIQNVGNVVFPPNMTWLQRLDISANPQMPKFPLPRFGLPFLHTLNMGGLPLILDVPTVLQIPRIQVINFTYSYHCCVFKDYVREEHLLSPDQNSENPNSEYLVQEEAEKVTLPPEVLANLIFPDHVNDPFDHTDNTMTPEQFRNELIQYEKQFNVRIVPIEGTERVAVVSNDNNGTNNVIGLLSDLETQYLHRYYPSFFVQQEVRCTPQEDALTPCKNLLDPQPLPVIVWIVWFIAVVSNLAVLFVLLVSKEKIEVPQFFICNLALADFLLGVYLAFLSAVDVRTRGNKGQSFYKSALTWQMGPGCQSAGFTAIFASELSVFVLTAMTLERLHTIAYSFKRGRLKMRYAVIIVIICWILAGVIASLPLLDINTYSDVAICLPFRLKYNRDKILIALILTINITAFLVILFCYMRILHLFCSSPSADQTSKKDKCVISLKMGILVLTNIICWLPLATVGYAAIANTYLINIIIAKYFVILIFPFNSCLNPFIYSIFTRQFMLRVKNICKRKDRFQLVNNQSSIRLSFRRNSIASASDTGSSATRTNSPRCDIDLDALGRRQSRRSFSVQLEPPNTNTLPSITTNVLSSGPYMGRRYSSPAIFATEPPPVSTRNLGLRFSSDLMHQSEQRTPTLVNSPSSGTSELHRTHSKCLSIVQEESDYESDNEEACPDLTPPPIMTRRYSNPDIRHLPFKGILIQKEGSTNNNKEESSIERKEEDSSQQNSPRTTNSQSRRRERHTPTSLHNHTLISHHRHSNNNNSHSSNSNSRDHRHSVRIINPHASKLSRLTSEETQV